MSHNTIEAKRKWGAAQTIAEEALGERPSESLRKKGIVVAIEVKSNAEKNTEGMEKFKTLFNPKSAFIVGDGGISAEDFLSMNLRSLFWL